MAARVEDGAPEILATGHDLDELHEVSLGHHHLFWPRVAKDVRERRVRPVRLIDTIR